MRAYKTINIWIVKGALFLIPLIPLYVSKSLFFPYITGKAFAFRILVEIAFAGWLFLLIFFKEYRPRLNILNIAVCAWLIVVLLATIFGLNPARSFWSNFERMEGLVAYLHLVAYFFVLGNVFNKNDWLIFLNIFVASGILEGFYGLFQKLGYLASPQGGINRPDGTIGNPTYLAAYLTFIVAFAALLFAETKNIVLRWYYALTVIFTLIVVYFTATRGAMVALLGGAFLAGILYLILARSNSAHTKRTKLYIILVLLILAGAASLIWAMRATPFVQQNPVLSRLTSISLTERTVESRFKIWRMGWEGFKERPILGWGPENYNIVFSKYFNPELWRQEPWFDRSHNIILDWLINAGALGLASFLGMFIAAILIVYKMARAKTVSINSAIIFVVALAVYFVQNLFVFDQIATYISLFALFALIYGNSRVISRESPAPFYVLTYAPFVLSVLIISLGFTAYFVNIKPYLANKYLLETLKSNNDVAKVFEYYQKALSYGRLGQSEITEQLVRFALSVGAQDIDAQLKDSIIRRAIEEAKNNAEANLQDPRAQLFLGSIYQNVGMLNEAVAVLNKAISLSPNKQQIYFELADAYIRYGDYKKAIEVSEKAFFLSQEFNQARINLAISYILDGQQEKADKLLLEYYETLEVPDILLTRVYARTKQYDRLLGIWKALSKSEPTNLDYRKNLIGAHLLLQHNTEAKTELERAINDFPSFRQEGEQYIKELGG